MYTFILSCFVVVAIILIVLVLVQHGKGADMGASFGSGASATLFGSSGTGTFLSRVTWGLLIAFFVLCIVIANLSKPTDSGMYDAFSESEIKNELSNVSIKDVDTMIPAPSMEATPKAETKETSVQDQIN